MRSNRNTKRLGWLLACGLGTVLCVMPGCKAVDNATGVNNANVGQSLKQPQGTLTRKELSLRLRRLAMSYLGEMSEACDQIVASDLPLEQRVYALRVRANSTDSVISIAADPDPQVALLNMVTALTLQRIVSEQRGPDFFGEESKYFIQSTRRMEDEIWKLAAQVLDEDERKQLRELIEQYRRDNPDEVYVWGVRFSEFSGYKEQFSIASIGRGVVDLFVPVGDAVSGIESTTDVAERATWLASRQSQIVQWRLELAYLEALAAPETAELLSSVNRVADTFEGLPGDITKERKAILKSIEEQEVALQALLKNASEISGEINDTTKEARLMVADIDQIMKTAEQTVAGIDQTIARADTSIANAKQILPETETALAQLEITSNSLNETIKTLDAFTKQFESDKSEASGRPFDINEYTVAVQEAGKTVAELNTLVNNLDRSADPARFDNTVASVRAEFSALIWQAGLVLLGAGLILILAAKLIPRRGQRS